jgi:hypothetical protein
MKMQRLIRYLIITLVLLATIIGLSLPVYSGINHQKGSIYEICRKRGNDTPWDPGDEGKHTALHSNIFSGFQGFEKNVISASPETLIARHRKGDDDTPWDPGDESTGNYPEVQNA